MYKKEVKFIAMLIFISVCILNLYEVKASSLPYKPEFVSEDQILITTDKFKVYNMYQKPYMLFEDSQYVPFDKEYWCFWYSHAENGPTENPWAVVQWSYRINPKFVEAVSNGQYWQYKIVQRFYGADNYEGYHKKFMYEVIVDIKHDSSDSVNIWTIKIIGNGLSKETGSFYEYDYTFKVDINDLKGYVYIFSFVDYFIYEDGVGDYHHEIRSTAVVYIPFKNQSNVDYTPVSPSSFYDKAFREFGVIPIMWWHEFAVSENYIEYDYRYSWLYQPDTSYRSFIKIQGADYDYLPYPFERIGTGIYNFSDYDPKLFKYVEGGGLASVLRLFDDYLDKPELGPMPIIEQYPYWTYPVYNTSTGETIETEVGNWTINYTKYNYHWGEAKYYYNPQYLNPDVYNWGFFEAIKQPMFIMVNGLIVIAQFLFYLVVASLNLAISLIIWVGVEVIWNILFYYIYIGIIWVGWWAYVGLLESINWIIENWSSISGWIMSAVEIIEEFMINFIQTYLQPIFEWIINEFTPVMVDILIQASSFLFALILYLITLGQCNYLVLKNNIYEMEYIIAEQITFGIQIIIQIIPDMITYLFLYILILQLLYIKYLYVKSRGYVNRTNQLYYSMHALIEPIQLMRKIIEQVKGWL